MFAHVCMQMVMGMLMSLLIIAFGAIFQLSLFLHNSFGILFFLFFLFQLAMASFAFLCSIPIRKVSSSLKMAGSVCPEIVCGFHPCLIFCSLSLSCCGPVPACLSSAVLAS